MSLNIISKVILINKERLFAQSIKQKCKHFLSYGVLKDMSVLGQRRRDQFLTPSQCYHKSECQEKSHKGHINVISPYRYPGK